MKPIYRTTLLSIVAGFSALATAQSTLPVTRTFQVKPSAKIDTATFSPAIDKTFRLQKVRPENELDFKLPPADPANKLTAGGIIPNLRASLLQGKFPGIEATGWTPPDPDMGVGPTHVVCVVNSSIGFFRKSDGKNTFLRTSEDFFQGMGAGSFQFDPKALYDPISKRFFILFLEEDDATKTSKSLIAVSDDSDPNGTWYRYRIENKLTVGSEDHWLDYPGWGVSKDYLGFCGNMFGFGNSWAGNQFVVINKASLLTGGAANVTVIHDPNNASVKFCQTTDSTDLLAVTNATQSQMRIYSVGTSGAKSTVVNVPAWNYPGDVVRGPSQHNLDSLDGRLFNAHYKNGSIVTTHNVSPTGDTRIMSRWYDFKLNGWPASGTPTLAQSGNVQGPSGTSLHMPAIAKNKRNEIALIFSRTSQTIMADLMVTGRKSTDVPGTMGTAVVRATTPALYGGGGGGYNRWGDYFGLAVDPADDLTFYALGMIGRQDGAWTTVVFPFKITSYDDLLGPIKASSIAALPSQGKLVSGPTTAVDKVDSIYANIDSQSVTGVGLVSSLTATYNTGLTPSTIGALQVNSKFLAPADATAFYYLWNVPGAKWEQVAASPANQTPTKFDRFENDAAPYLTAGGQVKVLVRIVRPNRSGSAPYTLKMDQLSISVATKL